jgi:hypothetical protein
VTCFSIEVIAVSYFLLRCLLLSFPSGKLERLSFARRDVNERTTQSDFTLPMLIITCWHGNVYKVRNATVRYNVQLIDLHSFGSLKLCSVKLHAQTK